MKKYKTKIKYSVENNLMLLKIEYHFILKYNLSCECIDKKSFVNLYYRISNYLIIDIKI